MAAQYKQRVRVIWESVHLTNVKLEPIYIQEKRSKQLQQQQISSHLYATRSI